MARVASPTPISSTSSVPLLQLSNATVVKGTTRVLDRLNLAIHDGEHTAILGPNGAGKTTLLNLLTFEDRAVAETGAPPAVRVFGRDQWHVFELRTKIGIVSAQSPRTVRRRPQFWRDQRLEAVISGFFATQGMLLYVDVTDPMREEARVALERVEAGHLAAKRLERDVHRRSTACADCASPRQPAARARARRADHRARPRRAAPVSRTVRRLANEGTTIVLITHHVEEIIPEIGQVVLLHRGRVAASGVKREMLTAERLSPIFGGAVQVEQADGYFTARA